MSVSMSPSPSQHSGQANPVLRPFFTLIRDVTTATHEHEHVHPQVQYIFSDDDPDTVTSSLFSDDAQHRVVLVDMCADGKTVQSADSLSPAWQVSRAVVSQAPSWNDVGPVETEGLKLVIEGVESQHDRRGDVPQDPVEEICSEIQRMQNDLGRLETLLDRSDV